MQWSCLILHLNWIHLIKTIHLCYVYVTHVVFINDIFPFILLYCSTKRGLVLCCWQSHCSELSAWRFLSPTVFSLLINGSAKPKLEDIADSELLKKVRKVSLEFLNVHCISIRIKLLYNVLLPFSFLKWGSAQPVHCWMHTFLYVVVWIHTTIH